MTITVRGDSGLVVLAVYDFCEEHELGYVLGYASNLVLERATAQALDDMELYYALYGRRDLHVSGWVVGPGRQRGRPRRLPQIRICGRGGR